MRRGGFAPAALLSLLSLLSASCADPEPATQVLVSFEADRAVQNLARDIQIEVWGGSRGDAVPSDDPQLLPLPLRDIVRDDTGEIWPVTHTLVPAGGDPSRLFRIEARLYDGVSTEPIGTVRAISGYVEGRSLVLRLRFYAQCLFVDPCENPEFSCNAAGDCQPARYDSTALPEVLGDGGITPEPACRTALDCDDGVACTDDVCFRGDCTHQARNDLCTASTDSPECDPDNGCQYGSGCSETGPGANCQAGDCEIARCQGDVCMRTSTCIAPQVCCGGVCRACNDAEACTIDGCDATSGTCSNVGGAGAPCDDGDFCTSIGTCQADGSCTAGPDPCAAGTTCDETARACVGCLDDTQCDDDVRLGTCVPDDSASPSAICMGAGVRSAMTTPYVCRTGTCVALPVVTTTESCTVAGSADGRTCDTTDPVFSGPCVGMLCATTGLRSGMRTLWTCGSGTCRATGVVTSTMTCTKSPDPSCLVMDSGMDSEAGMDSGVESGTDARMDSETGTGDTGVFDSDTGTADSGTFDTFSECSCSVATLECGGEITCDDGDDNDCDGVADCADADCMGVVGRTEIDCFDGFDNDCDGLSDCADGDCIVICPPDGGLPDGGPGGGDTSVALDGS